MAKKMIICARCHSTGEAKINTPGSFFVELLLWCFFLLPGMLYTAWRLTQRGPACSACGAAEVLPLDSPRGRTLAQQAA